MTTGGPGDTGSDAQGADGLGPARDEDDGTALLDLVRPVWSQRRTAEALGLQNHAVLRFAAEDRTVLGLPLSDSDDLVFPVWQFRRRAGAVAVLPGLLPVLDELGEVDQWAVAVWLRIESPEIGCTALELVKSDPDSEALLALARSVASEWSDGRPSQTRSIRRVLAGHLSFDDIDPEVQAGVRREWTRRMDARRSGLNLEAEFRAQGRAWTELDETGQLVRREPGPDASD
ncbi:hypothetical protein [Aeromicrobium sp. 50.2.37]|uniref:hypothetical protein n=1 Tax=Aeromicrobium sp. 50.2.37 TaxID=2969305 RepID=UPI00215039C6|nr:hypothetical protein [Aeromicrobium sp. 50.2.37]MCR4512667.1 hypothetical protein [Aeromicrobium sp. 50.2.37]